MANWKGTVVPNTGYVEKIYINTNISNDEYYNILKNITFIDASVLGQSGWSFYPVMGYLDANSIPYVLAFKKFSDTYIDFALVNFSNMKTIQDFFIGDKVWQSFENPYNIGYEVLSTLSGLPLGNQNELLKEMISITPFEEIVEPITNLPEFLTGIADAIREVKGTTEKINAQNYKPEILKFKELIGSGGGLVEPITITKNGVYNSFYKTEEVTINQDTEFDFEVEGMLFKKVPQLSIPEDADIINNNEKYTLYGIGKSGGATIIEMSKTLGELKYTYDQTYGVGMLSDPTAQLSVLWVKDPAYLNTSFGSDVFESNTVYVTNFLATAIASEYGVTFDEWEITLNAPGNKKLNGVSPINVDTRSGLAIEFEYFPSTDDTIPYALYCKKRYTGVLICYGGKVSDISLLMPCYGISYVYALPTEDMFYTTKKGEYYNMYYYVLESDKQLYVFFKDGEKVTQLSGTEFATTFFGENLPYRGEVFIKDAYNITTDGYFVVYDYDYYTTTYSLVNGELTKNWTPVNNNNIRGFQRVSSTNGVTYKTELGKHIYGSVSYFWFVNKTPISGVYTSAGESDDGTLTCTLSSQKIFDSFGSGTFEITLIVRSTDSVCRFEDCVLNTTITIDENGNSV